MKIVKIKRRSVNEGHDVFIGTESDNLVERISFEGILSLNPDQLVTLHWTIDGQSIGDIVTLVKDEENYTWDVGNTITQYGGTSISAYIRVTYGQQRWSTQSFRLVVSTLPIDGVTPILTPTVIDELLAVIAGHNKIISDNVVYMNGTLAEAVAAKNAVIIAQELVNADAQQVSADKATVSQDRIAADSSALAAEKSELAAGVSAADAQSALENSLDILEDVVIDMGIVSADKETVARDKSEISQMVLAIEEDKNTVVSAKDIAVAAKDVAVSNSAIVAEDKQTVNTYMSRAESAALDAEESDRSAGVSATQAGQSLSDFIAMLGTDVATLVGGKVPIGQIPATAIMEIFLIADESELTLLPAQKADMAEVHDLIDGVDTIVKAYQLIGEDPTIRSNWVVWGTSYAVQAGNATTADNAINATKINDKRLVGMSQTQYDTAQASGTLDPMTYYIVTPD